MAKNWYVKHKGRIVGPATSTQLKQFATSGKISRDTEVRLGDDGEWVSAASVQGLWTQVAATKPSIEQVAERALYQPPVAKHQTPATTAPARRPATTAPISIPPPVPATVPDAQYEISPASLQATQKACMFCGESIAQTAIKCRHCNEFLDGRPRETAVHQQQPMYAPQPVIHVTQVNNTSTVAQPRWNPGVAALLSFLLPGLGQMYKGQVFNGIAWLVIVPIGYLAFIIPGLFLHVCCIAGAASGDPTR